jgi:hypothetical protein
VIPDGRRALFLSGKSLAACRGVLFSSIGIRGYKINGTAAVSRLHVSAHWGRDGTYDMTTPNEKLATSSAACNWSRAQDVQELI